MHLVVPLAGPDFVRVDGSMKALTTLDGAPLLRSVLLSRPWAGWVPPAAYVFVLHDEPGTRAFATGELREWFPGARVVFLSGYTRGAALSAAAGVAAVAGSSEPLIVDLADIRFAAEVKPADVLSRKNIGGLALTFESTDPAYSYLRTDGRGNVVAAAEKPTISRNASAGVYGFSSAAVYFRAVAHSFEHEEQTYGGLHYVCPLFNGVLAQGLDVELATVSDVLDIKQQEVM